MKTDFILTAEGVNKTFDGFKAIDDLNFYLDRGELRTIIGPNGAKSFSRRSGRTTDMGTIEYCWDLSEIVEYEFTA
jgi:urea transport system ATP-binding protein